MIEIKQVSKTFADKKVINNITFKVNEGDIFGFLGPNGAGKTTTIKMIIGLLEPTSGEIFINGKHNVKNKNDIYSDIGVVFELPNLYMKATIQKNLEMFSKIYQLPSSRVDEVMEDLQLIDKKNMKVEKLSKGWKQRVLIARALLHKPKVLILDEPTSGLDPNTVTLIRDYIKKLNSEGTTIIISTQAMNIGGQEIFLLSVWILFAQVMVGIMLTGPNIIEEREAKTIDALLCTPLTFREIMFSKGLAILILSMFSQINVYIINRGITSELFVLIIPMLIGGSLFILLGEIIGLKVGTSQEGSAVSSIVMVLLFLIVSVYESFPEWIGKFMIMIPSISVAEIMNGIMADNTVLLLQSVIVFTWFVLGVIYIKYIEKKWTH
ncbi:ABC transporter ATP-binding protein/permease [Clostridium algidicarnis]|uniref:ABC transporter ATP-binding protein/permease n=1 Tax=Clostridium algidicarnis TaxID=37659 RepID=UPI0006912B8E|nr:ABC transporter ATP-binding protein/permease [Clostridium algidicarnis]